MATVYFMQGLLLLFALWRGTADSITLTLLASWFVTSTAGVDLEGAQRAAFLAVADCAVALAMLGLWTAATDMRAWAVGLIGWLKTSVRLAFVSFPSFDPTAYAAIVGLAFFAQIIVAGGFADGVGVKLDCMLLRFFPRRHSLLRNSET